MSISSCVELGVSDSIEFSVLAAIRLLLNAGWSFNYEGSVFYLPIGDDGDFDWQREDLSASRLLDILSKKEELGELIGVTMTWEETGVGGEFLFHKSNLIVINLSINRQVTLLTLTDVNWYLSKLIPALRGGGISVESIVFSEHV